MAGRKKIKGRALTLAVVLVACVGFRVSHQLHLRFESLPEDSTVSPNGTVTLHCDAERVFGEEEAKAPVEIEWRKDGEKLNLLSNDSSARIYQLSNGSLVVQRFESRSDRDDGNENTDEGRYRCVATGPEGVLLSKSATVKAAATPFFPDDGHPQSTSVHRGGAARFRCSVGDGTEPPVEYSWKFNQGNLPQNSRFTVIPGGALQIADARFSDSGFYQCIASNIAGVALSNKAFLNVLLGQDDSTTSKNIETKPLVMRARPSNVSALIGTDVVLECLPDGYPYPEVSWFFSTGHPIDTTNNSHYTIFGRGNLMIIGATEQDRGLYVCKSTIPGSLSSILTSAFVEMLIPPKLIETPKSFSLPIAQTARFTCLSDSSTYPTPITNWYRNGMAVNFIGRIKKMDGGKTLLISQLTTSDDGIYQCIIENKVGSVTAAAKLTVNISGNEPASPTNLKALSLKTTSVTLEWEAVLTSISRPIVAYSVHYFQTKGGLEFQKIEMENRAYITELKPFTNYTFYVVAYNKESASEHSNYLTLTTKTSLPLAVPDFVVTPTSSTSLRLDWNELPIEKTRGIITSYKILLRSKVDPEITVREIDGKERRFTLTGLKPGTSYDVLLLAGTTVGYPVYNEEMWKTVSMPAQNLINILKSPSMNVNILNATAVLINWNSNAKNVMGYKLFYNKETESVYGPIIHIKDVTSHLLSDLQPGSVYIFKLVAFNINGESGPVTQSVHLPSKFQTTTVDLGDQPKMIENTENNTRSSYLPPPPHNIRIAVRSPDSVSISWQPPFQHKHSYNTEVVRYTIKYKPFITNRPSDPNISLYKYKQSARTKILVTDLLPFYSYVFHVRSHTRLRVGSYSNATYVHMPEDTPSSPVSAVWTAIGPTRGRVEWQPPLRINGVLLKYVVRYKMLADVSSWNSREKKKGSSYNWLEKSEQPGKKWSILNNLIPNSRYFIKIYAVTGAGRSQPSKVLTITTPDCKTCYFKDKSNLVIGTDHSLTANTPVEEKGPFLGITLGVSVGLSCIILCIFALAVRNKCFPHFQHQAYQDSNSYGFNGNKVTNSRFDNSKNSIKNYSAKECQCCEQNLNAQTAPIKKELGETIDLKLLGSNRFSSQGCNHTDSEDIPNLRSESKLVNFHSSYPHLHIKDNKVKATTNSKISKKCHFSKSSLKNNSNYNSLPYADNEECPSYRCINTNTSSQGNCSNLKQKNEFLICRKCGRMKEDLTEKQFFSPEIQFTTTEDETTSDVTTSLPSTTSITNGNVLPMKSLSPSSKFKAVTSEQTAFLSNLCENIISSTAKTQKDHVWATAGLENSGSLKLEENEFIWKKNERIENIYLPPTIPSNICASLYCNANPLNLCNEPKFVGVPNHADVCISENKFHGMIETKPVKLNIQSPLLETSRKLPNTVSL